MVIISTINQKLSLYYLTGKLLDPIAFLARGYILVINITGIKALVRESHSERTARLEVLRIRNVNESRAHN